MDVDKPEGEQFNLVEPIAAKLEVMREAMNDPLFLADLEEVKGDFKRVNLAYVRLRW
jgi:hypothetical protein